MGQPVSQIRDTYPLPVYNYRVTILQSSAKGLAGLGGATLRPDGADSLRFSEVTGLNLQYEPVIYRDGFSFITGPNLIPGLAKEVNISLKRGLLRKDDYLYAWLMEAQGPLQPGHGKRDIVVDLCDEAGLPVIRWTVYGALPTSLTAPDFSAEANQVAIETLELIAAGLRVEFSP